MSQKNFTEPFKDSLQRFTLFAPSNEGWINLDTLLPSEYKELQSSQFGEEISTVFQRHLIINKELTIEELRELSMDTSEETRLLIENGDDLSKRLIKSTQAC